MQSGLGNWGIGNRGLGFKGRADEGAAIRTEGALGCTRQQPPSHSGDRGLVLAEAVPRANQERVNAASEESEC